MKWKVSSHYGCLSVSRIVEADTEEEAFNFTGVASDLERLGYEVEVEDEAIYEVENIREVTG